MNDLWQRATIAVLMLCSLLLLGMAAAQWLNAQDQASASLLLAVTLALVQSTLSWNQQQRPWPWATLQLLLLSITTALWLSDTIALWLVVSFSCAAALSSVCLSGALWTRPRNSPPCLAEHYQSAVAARRIQPHAAQLALVTRLDRLLLDHAQIERSRWLPWAWLRKPPAGVYLYGQVGRGKSFLMDAMYELCASPLKRRWHMHELMARLHKYVNGGLSPQQAAAQLAPRYGLLVIDEVSLNDTASTLLFTQVLLQWWRMGCLVCCNSNQPYASLLPDGAREHQAVAAFQRRFERQMEEHTLDIDADFRQQKLSGADLYQYPITADTESRLLTLLTRVIDDRPQRATAVPVNGRTLTARFSGQGAAWFGFDELCGAALDYTDYLWLAERFPTLIVSDVPHLNTLDRARRFAWLVEIIYDARKRLILSAQAPLDNLFADNLVQEGAVDFSKIQSRLVEMQSAEYDYSPTRQRS